MEEERFIRLAIVGARTFRCQATFDEAIEEFVKHHGRPSEVISGDAIGADTLGRDWAKRENIPYVGFAPHWRPNGIYDKAAGLKRNTDIVNKCTHMLAFPSPTGRGTQDSIRKAQAAKKVVVVKWV